MIPRRVASLSRADAGGDISPKAVAGPHSKASDIRHPTTAAGARLILRECVNAGRGPDKRHANAVRITPAKDGNAATYHESWSS